jgi:hypothetical protein
MRSLDQLSRELPSRHGQYISTVSDSAHAISLELARFILEVASENHAKRLLDLGSGFTSYVLRAYAAGVPGSVALSGRRRPSLAGEDPWISSERGPQH